MPAELAFIVALLAALVSVSTLIGFAVRSGERNAMLKRLDEEVGRLRERMHAAASSFSGVQVAVGELGVKVDGLTKAIEKLDQKMERREGR